MVNIKPYNFIYNEYGNTTAVEINVRGKQVFSSNFTNKSTAFSEKERMDFKLDGIFPPAVRALERQISISIDAFNKKESDIEKFIYIRSLFDRNATLAHALISTDIEKYMKIIYTPTVGLACRYYSSMFRQANGIHFYPGNIDNAENILSRYSHRNIRVAVVTDNQGILGIGDQGAGGIAICLGKLMLYTQGAGIAPWHCLPISLDVGTDNRELLNLDNYLGWRHPRLKGDEYLNFIRRFADAFLKVFPNAICQWEDFSKQNAFEIKDAYLNNLISFNDDIQGTGAIALSAVIAAMKIKKEEFKDQVFLIHGAGAGGIGIAEQIEASLISSGISQKEARDKIFTIDSRGLIVTNRDLEPYKIKFAKTPVEMNWYKSGSDGNLLNVIKNAKVTVIIGTSGQAGSFSKDVVEAVMTNTPRPVILPLSNPNSIAEADPGDIYKWTEGKALVATGSPFKPVEVPGKKIRIGQCNNVFIFPGVGLGTISSGAREIKPSFFTAASRAVAESISDEDLKKGIIIPPIDTLAEVSVRVACAVGEEAIRSGVSGPCYYSTFQHKNDPELLKKLILNMIWKPVYLPFLPV